MVRLAVRSRPLSSRAIAAKSRMATLGDVAESAAKSDVVNAQTCKLLVGDDRLSADSFIKNRKLAKNRARGERGQAYVCVGRL
jgi:hypothetical protein